MPFVLEPNAIRDNLVEAEAELRGAACEGDYEFGIEKRFAARKAEQLDTVSVGVFEELDRSRNVEAIGPFDGDATMRTREVALIGAGEGNVIRTERARAAR